MSRCADPQLRLPGLTRVVGCVLLTGLLASGSVAVAAPRPGPAAPVLTIVAPVLDLQFGESDLQREARVEQQPRRTRITLDSTVLFAKDSARINSRARGRLSEVARQLKGQGTGSVQVTGYTDDLGSAAHGRTLSRQRAGAVARVLRGDLPSASYPMTVVGKGEADPAVPNTSEANRKINRRVVVVYQKR